MSRSWQSLRHAASGALLLVVLALASACSEPPVEETIEVEGALLAKPTIVYRPPFEVPALDRTVVVEGQGDRLVSDEPVLLHYRLESAATGELIDQTFGALPKTYLLTPEDLSLELYDALVGTPVGSRILLLTPADDAAGTVATVLVADVLSTRAEGAPVEPRAGLPTVTLDEEGAPLVQIPEGDPPTDLEVQTLVRGSGEQLTASSSVVVQYTMVRWSDGSVVDSTWDAVGPRAFSLAETITGWNDGLAEQTVGSRVLLVAPPVWAFGDQEGHDLSGETLVYVVDILAATTPKEK
ncbi:MAG: FKBP-type peptidyl-prolyl cis-trans isomerase [Actinomycetota bacterium]|nr:FKBP-type peptidyl-prolyl cis-trans isomerase [Actinomycetota bacterium]